ncbi:MAG: hypothetical protein GC157_03385 [Frankiales bacterium]|nr:hypothetical protein [Frankiales bacterium]
MDDSDLIQEVRRLRRLARVALILAAVAVVVGPFAGALAAKYTAIPGPAGPAGEAGATGAQGPAGPRGPSGQPATNLVGALVLNRGGCPPGTIRANVTLPTWPLIVNGTVQGPFVNGTVASSTIGTCFIL